jgi:aryl-alcohol dehydrogenase-like predicted oxidoreductase
MRQNRLGKTGLVVSEIGMGTMTFGTMADEKAGFEIMDKAFAAGVNFLDTAEMYPVPPNKKYAGRTEEICGKWMKDRPRDSVILATKIAGPGGGWFLGPMRSGHTGLDRPNIERAVEASLQRLGTDYIDLYQTHWPDPDLPSDETREALDRLVEDGKVRAVGCSNQSGYGLMKSLWSADRNGTVRYETIQNSFSLLNRRFEDDLAEVCRRESVSLLPYSPSAGGVLSGKYQGGAFPDNARFSQYRQDPARGKAMAARFINARSLEACERFAKIASDSGLSLTTFATAWTLSRDFVASTLIGATSAEQLDDTLAAASVTLPADALEACDQVSKEILYPLG